jgi:hypothetical protein
MTRQVLPVVTIAHRRLWVGMARMSLSCAHVAVAGVQCSGDAGMAETTGTGHDPGIPSKARITW